MEIIRKLPSIIGGVWIFGGGIIIGAIIGLLFEIEKMTGFIFFTWVLGIVIIAIFEAISVGIDRRNDPEGARMTDDLLRYL